MNTNHICQRSFRCIVCLIIVWTGIMLFMEGLLFSAGAERTLATVGGRSYTSVSDAWRAAMAVNNSVIDMTDDWNLTGRLTVKGGVTVTVNMHNHVINRGNVDFSEPDYASDSSGNGSVFLLEDNARLIINGCAVNDSVILYPGSRKGDKGIWVYDGKGSTVLRGALITGGATDSSAGGAFTLQKGSKLEMYDVTVAGNVADEYLAFYGMGGAVLMKGDKASLTMERCSFLYNFADDSGGAVCVDDGTNCTLKLTNCTLTGNYAASRGGAVCISGDAEGCRIEMPGTVISSNRAETGGGIYANERNVTVKRGEIRDNTASGIGGGVYFKYGSCTLDTVTVTGNRAATAGGVYMQTGITLAEVPVLTLSGKIIIRDNMTLTNEKSNLYLTGNGENNSFRVLVSGNPSVTSDIWVSCWQDGYISDGPGSYNDAIYHADKDGKEVYWNQRSDDRYFRYLVLDDRGTTVHTNLPLVTLEPADISRGCGNLERTALVYEGYPVYKGFGGTDSTDEVGVYYYSDGYFMTDPDQYNAHLATLSIRLAMAAMNSSVWRDSQGTGYSYKLQPNHIKQMLSDIGCADEDIMLSDTYLVKPGTDTIGYAIGMKPLRNQSGQDSGYVLVPIAVRGAGYEAEWTSNVTLGKNSDKEHQGFREAANQVLEGLEAFLDQHDLRQKLDDGKLKFWVVGFSRAGATANLTAKTLTDCYRMPYGNQVYGYTFEAPQGGMADCIDENTDYYYYSIHNILLAGDVVPHVAMITMDFQRYGVDHYLPGTPAGTPERYWRRYAGSLSGDEPAASVQGTLDDKAIFLKDNDYYDTDTLEYQAQKQVMLRQLAATDSARVFDDYFHLATVSVDGVLFMGSLLQPFGNDSVTLADWLPDFIYYINEWMTGRESSRERYVNIGYERIARQLMEASNAGTLDTGKALDRLKAAMTVDGILDVIFDRKEGKGSDSDRYRLADLLYDSGMFDSDAIPLTRDQVEPVMGLLIRLLDGDTTEIRHYSQGTSVPYGDDEEYLVMLPTLLFNADRIKLNHNHDVVYAWLRSYDSYYTGNPDHVSDESYAVRAADRSDVDKPYLTVKINGVQKRFDAGTVCAIRHTDRLSDVTVHNAPGNAGGEIFCSLQYTANEAPDDYYHDGTDLTDAILAGLGYRQYAVLSARTVWYNTPGETAVFYITLNQDRNAVYLNGQLYGLFAPGEPVTVTDPEGDEDSLTAWTWSLSGGTAVSSFPVGAFEPVADGNMLSFIMPEKDVYLTASLTGLHRITVTQGRAYDASGAQITFAAPGAHIHLEPVPDHGSFEFRYFTLSQYHIIHDGAGQSTVYTSVPLDENNWFIMPDAPVVAEAVFVSVSPVTGDRGQPGLWLMLGILSAAVLAVTCAGYRRIRKG